MASCSRIVDRDLDSKTVDKGLKNVWKWEWLERKVGDELVGRFLRKLNSRGMAYCELCSKDINYASRGWKALEQHILKKLHTENRKIKATNQSLSGIFGQKCTKTKEPYGIHPMFKASAKIEEPVNLSVTPLNDRVINAEAMVLGFTAENSLSFTLVPRVIELAKTLAADKKALDSLTMNRTTASYKTVFGLGKTFEDQLLDIMSSNFFSLNMDESTSSNFQKVLTILVSYFCPVKKQVVVQHFSSLTCIKVNSEALFDKVVGLMEGKNVPWSNLMSILMDSCNVMRGSKSGLEVRIRNQKAPHLLDIDGDVCHHVHNAAKAFCKPFNWFLEQLFSDLFNDFKWSPDLRDYLQEICIMLNIKYTMPQRYVSHRWLSVYDVALDTLRLFDALTVFYFPLLTESERVKHLPIVVEVYHRLGVSVESRDRILEIRKELISKKLTKDGKDRKDRIVHRLFTERKLIKMTLGLYSSVLPLLKNFVLLFEMKEPLIHELYEKQVELFKEFLGCFVKPEVLSPAGNSSFKLKRLDISKGNLLKPEVMFMGAKALRLIQGSRAKDYTVKSFLTQLEEAYLACGNTLQQKLAITNTFLKAVSGIHPDARGHSVTLKMLQKLPTLAPNVLTEDEEESFEKEIRKFQGSTLPEFEGGTRIDVWWGRDDLTKKYPCLCKMVRAVLSCFHGPQVESSFNVMNDIIDNKSGRINIDTYNAIQNVKFGVRASETSSIELFRKKDYLHDRVNPLLIKNMRTSCKQYKCVLERRKTAAEEKKDKLKVKPGTVVTKRKAKELYAKAAKKARISHSTCVVKKK